MSEPTRNSGANTHQEIEARASDFIQRRRFWQWTELDEITLAVWLDESIVHRTTYLRLAAGAARVERLAALREPQRQSIAETTARARTMRRIVWPFVVGVATLALIATIGPAVIDYFMLPADHSFATAVGGKAVLTFSDGTQMELNTDTAVRYRMTTQERIVWLDRGEAYFRVAHDAAHPFVVVAGHHRVTDLGTEFLVRSDKNQLEVSLVQGRAQLTSDDPGAGHATLTPGDDAVATSDDVSISRKTPQQIADELAWQRGVLVFRGTPLTDVVEEFNRYNKTKLVIGDSRISTLRVGGEFRAENLSEFLQLAQAVLKLHATQTGADIVLSRVEKVRGAVTTNAPDR